LFSRALVEDWGKNQNFYSLVNPDVGKREFGDQVWDKHKPKMKLAGCLWGSIFENKSRRAPPFQVFE